MKRSHRIQRRVPIIRAEKETRAIDVYVSSEMTDLIPDDKLNPVYDKPEDFAPGFDTNISNINYHFSYMRENSTYTSSGDTDSIEFGTFGTLTESETTVEIAYKENESLGMNGLESRLRFKKNTPQKINLIRSGAAPTSMIFDCTIPRRPCTYSIGGEAFDFVIITNSVVNEKNGSGGKIVLDYVIEIHGVETERNVYTLEYRIKEQ